MPKIKYWIVENLLFQVQIATHFGDGADRRGVAEIEVGRWLPNLEMVSHFNLKPGA